METFQNLFGPENAYGDVAPLARATDPPESHAAAEEIAPKVSAHRTFAVECVRKCPGKTARELGEMFCPDEPGRIWKRVGECAKLGLLRRGESRPCSITGKKAATWFVVEASNGAA
jgi:hypothetical protein